LSRNVLVVLGIDPGLRATGWAVLALADGEVVQPELACPSGRRVEGPRTLDLSPPPEGGGIDSPSHGPTFRLGRRSNLAPGDTSGMRRSQRDQLEVLAYGAVQTDSGATLPERLRHIAAGLREVIERWQPAEAAVEEAFVAANKRVAIAMGEARGVALLAAAEAGLPVFEYSPSEVKQAVSGYGRGSKEQVQEMLRLQLGLEAAPQPADAADALATALCHIVRRRAEARLGLPKIDSQMHQ